MILDLILDYDTVISAVKTFGIDHWFREVSQLYPDRDLYSVSTDWMDHSGYIAKFRGAMGDVLVGWKGVHHP